MFSFEELMSKRNQRLAFEHLSQLPNSLGTDGIWLNEIADFWSINHEKLIKELAEGIYIPSLIKQREIVKKSGGKRVISYYGSLDRFLLRLLSQKLNRYLEPLFLDNSFAFREGKGVVAAVKQATDYFNTGKSYLLEVDLHHYFDEINLEKLIQYLETYLDDQQVLQLLKLFIYCQVSDNNNKLTKITKGVIQGSAISPVLSNLYLHRLDLLLEDNGYDWIRYADNIYLFFESREEGEEAFGKIQQFLNDELDLKINQKKSGLFKANDKRMLGYEFSLVDGIYVCKKHEYVRLSYYESWHRSKLKLAQQQYYIVDDGILNKKDFSLLFENEKHKHHLPIANVEQINIYSNVIIPPEAMRLLYERRIPLIIHDKYGHIQSYILPETMKSAAKIILAQCQLYLDEKQRLTVAKAFETAHFHNLRSNCRYYLKKKPNDADLLAIEKELSQYLAEIKTIDSIDKLMLLEARARQRYYQFFNQVINQEGFSFTKRSKRPPKDPLNALISFCNTVLYGQVMRALWKVGLDPKIAVLHASTNRPYSLQLDFADYMKPVIVDRVILSLINRHIINAEEHFMVIPDGGIYLNPEGKRLVLKAFEEKLGTKQVIKNSSITYWQLICRDTRQFKQYLLGEISLKDFKPYKYY
ncbi:CRISPR-associated endonuclease Cas1 [Streptococcus sp. sy018]|uniref:CRISPR-associated endonuclease Cas1 n=1 Tax=Streptococcus sp. sy018 TaxID=2600147 RepID=UPI0011B67882|nr:CRISPR-associated endonuclease Cas1 [Streptococcus sp. sy018]TWS95562.1 CRISPR-associated endonuclease Cas1 [Streptococcus sp. sy018]